MSRVAFPLRPYVWRGSVAAACAGLLLGSIGTPIAAQELPPCSDERAFDCVLPDWADAGARDLPSFFGELDPVVWVDDVAGDAPTDGLDILGAGIARVEIAEPKPIRQSDELIKRGKRKQAVPRGEAVVVRVVLDRPVDQVEGGHSSIHVTTDVDGSRSNNAPTGRADPTNPFAGSQDVYSLTWASTTGKTRALSSDLAKRWYKARQPFAATWAAPTVLDLLVAPEAFGEDFRVITHVGGEAGGYDELRFGPGAIPTDGEVGLVPSCIEGSISAEPYVVNRLVENGQTLRNVEARASWRGGAALPLDESTRTTLAASIASADEDGDGRIGISSTVSLFEDGIVIRQRPEVELALDGDTAYLAVELGLTRRGYNVVRDFELEETGDEALDAWLERATDALSGTMPPFRSNRKGGLVAGEGIGSCVPWLEPPPEPEPTPGPDADETAEPDSDDAATSA